MYRMFNSIVYIFSGCCEPKNKDRDTRVKAVITEEYDKLGPVT